MRCAPFLALIACLLLAACGSTAALAPTMPLIALSPSVAVDLKATQTRAVELAQIATRAGPTPTAQIGQGPPIGAPPGIAITPTPVPLTADRIINEFRAHGLRVKDRPATIGSVPAGLVEYRSVVDGGAFYLGLLIFATPTDALAYANRSRYQVIKVAQRNAVLEYLTNDTAEAQPYLAIFLSMR